MSNIDLGLDMASLDTGLRQATITGVIVHAGASDSGATLDYQAGTTSGNVLEVSIPNGTQKMAQSILDGLRKRGFRYQPFEAGNTMTDPAIEIGDNVLVRNVPSVVMGIQMDHTRLMTPTLTAPYDEELDHEFKYEPRTEREFKREVKYSRSRLTLNADAITAEVVRASNMEADLSARVQIAADAITSEVSRASSEEGRLSTRITQTAESIASEVSRASSAEGDLSSRITQAADAITAEVTRASGAEGNLSSRITQTADAITSEVSRASSAEGNLSTQIAQRLDGITLTASSSAGSSTFTIKDGSTTLATQTLDLSVKAANISGKLTVGQLTDGSVVVSSYSSTEYYLSTSTASATGSTDGWTSIMPTWESGKYLWVRLKTTDTKNDGSTSISYSPQNGRFDKNLTNALATAAAAAAGASGAQTSANSAVMRTSTIYHSMSGGTVPTKPTTWVSTSGGSQNVWTLKRPEYSSSYPALYTARQSETVGGTYSCSDPVLDATTTVIDGAHIITGTVDASKIAVSDLSALNATIAGWKINSTYLSKTNAATEAESTMRVRINAFANPTSTDNAISVATRASVNDAWTTQFSVSYGGRLTANTGVFHGDVSAGNIKYGEIGSTNHGYFSGGGILSGSLGTGQLSLGVNTSLGHADTVYSYFNGVEFAGTFSSRYMTATNSISSPLISSTNGGETIYLSSHKHYVSVSDGTVSINGPAPSSTSGNSFNIADTKFYKDAVASAREDGEASVSVSSVSITRTGESTVGKYAYVQVSLSNGTSSTRIVYYS